MADDTAEKPDRTAQRRQREQRQKEQRAQQREERKKRPYPTRSHPGVAGRKPLSTVVVRNVTFRVDGMYSAKEVALILGVSHWTVQRWISEGRLTAYKLGDAPNSAVRVHGRTILGLLKKVVKIKQQQAAKKKLEENTEAQAKQKC